MKVSLTGAAALLTISTSLFAADLPSRRAPPVYVAPVPVFTWTGGYFGVNAGYAFNNRMGSTLSANDPAAAVGLAVGSVAPFVGTRSNGFTGGGQIGYNYQLNTFNLFGIPNGGVVFGVEADASYTDLNRTATFVGTGGIATVYPTRTEFVGTVRGRLGYGFDRFLVYGTGGFAYGGVRSGATIYTAAGAPGYTGRSDRLQSGYAYGGGIEYALPTGSFLNFFQSSAVTIKAEYLHYDLGSNSTTINGVAGVAVAGSSFNDRVRTQGNLVRAGLNFKFGVPAVATPIVAKY